MRPFARLAFQAWRHRDDPALGPMGTHESRHLCRPHDLDPWLELSNGRTLTLRDLGRVPRSNRIGLSALLRERGWQVAVAVAGAAVRWRRRVHAFDRLAMRTRALGWDGRLLYCERSLWLGWRGPEPELPPFERGRIEAEALRPWPPKQG